MTQSPLGVLNNMTVGTTLITVVTSLPKTIQGRMQLILIWNQPLEIVSLVWTPGKWLLEQHKEVLEEIQSLLSNIARGCSLV